ncbi:nucleoporin NUP35 [Onthophagus taurus]|uniref:nucleoporin NUP35 n=1 Tax=Onthophagus taurus TaxID=166361 RepID=UPI000C20E35C|nr:nucleoporin NUP53 [Onthophagus taurus]XP_022905536.1 nucleoporin NUP53 [Onthophagus taurus]XP_022905537.1 nucleoporin NUP53 [Onthophagus taurus]
MEPMALGSPSSPTTPGINPNFLPSFLMGETQTLNSSNIPTPGASRTPNVKYTSTPDSRNLRQKLFNQSLNESYQNNMNQGNFQSPPYNNVQPERTGPPKQGLFDTIDKSTPPVLSSTVQFTPGQGSFPTESFSIIGNESINYNIISPGHDSMNKFNYTSIQHKQQHEGMWVTVFGFPPSATSLVLAQLANYGSIVDKKFPTQGNWIHLKYSSPLEANKALALHGKLISNSIMIGVVPFVNKNKSENKENMENDVSTPVRARSLRQSYITPQPSSPVVPQNVPQKSTGLVGKAMEYVFGW